MKRRILILGVIISFLMVSCSVNSASIKAVDEGKIALVSKEYEKAKDLFNLAIKEDKNNEEGKILLELTSDYIKLLTSIEEANIDNTEDLIKKIEKNKKIDLIKNDFDKQVNTFVKNKEKIIDNISEIENIEKVLKEGNIDEAKTLASNKLIEVKGVISLEKRLNDVIIQVDQVILDAKNEILKYNSGIELEYIGLQPANGTMYGHVVENLKDKVLLKYKVPNNPFSPIEFVYNRDDGNIYRHKEGQVFWVNNGYIALNELDTKVYSKSLSPQEAGIIAIDYFISRNSTYNNKDLFTPNSDIIDNNEYYRPICGYDTDPQGNEIIGKPLAEYMVNVITGEIRVLWD